MKRLFIITICFFAIKIGAFWLSANFDFSMYPKHEMLYADPPDEEPDPPDDDTDPPDFPIINSPAPSDTIIYDQDGRPITIIIE